MYEFECAQELESVKLFYPALWRQLIHLLIQQIPIMKRIKTRYFVFDNDNNDLIWMHREFFDVETSEGDDVELGESTDD